LFGSRVAANIWDFVRDKWEDSKVDATKVCRFVSQDFSCNDSVLRANLLEQRSRRHASSAVRWTAIELAVEGKEDKEDKENKENKENKEGKEGKEDKEDKAAKDLENPLDWTDDVAVHNVVHSTSLISKSAKIVEHKDAQVSLFLFACLTFDNRRAPVNWMSAKSTKTRITINGRWN